MVNRALTVVFIVSLAGFADSSIAAAPADFKGARTILREAADAAARPEPKAEQPSPAAQLRTELDDFAKLVPTLAPAEAAAQWLLLVEKFAELPSSSRQLACPSSVDSQVLTTGDLVEVLPPPAAWPELARAIDARPEGKLSKVQELGLRLLAHSLVNDTERRRADIRSLQALAAKANGGDAWFFAEFFRQLGESVVADMDDHAATMQLMEQRLAAARAQRSYPGLEVPGLVDLVGAEKAEAFLRKALIETKVELRVPGGTATARLTQKLALELVDQLQVPQWSLVDTLDAVQLYEAMDKKFPAAQAPTQSENPFITAQGLAATQDDYQRRSAEACYLLGLIAQGRTADAVAAAKRIKSDGDLYIARQLTSELERAGFTNQLNSFLHAVLKDNPELPFWGTYARTAAHAGKTQEMADLVRETIVRPDLSKSRLRELQQHLRVALLANDELEEGVQVLRRELTTSDEDPGYSLRSGHTQVELALDLAKLGQLLNRPEWIEEGISAARKAGEAPENEAGAVTSAVMLGRFLSSMDRGAEAEEVLTKALSAAMRLDRSAERNEFFDSYQPTDTQSVLQAMAEVYYRSGRHEDVLYLFDSANGWGVADVVELNGDSPVPMGYYAAWALAKANRRDEAKKINDVLLDEHPDCDRLYELLLTLDEQNAPSKLDQMFARDQFEERPLIWKACWLRTHGKLEEAEAAARKAIATDPTDGEEGPGDRLRAYEELAHVREARGDRKEAAFLRSIVRSVRDSEQADGYYEAGLLKRAVGKYQNSLNTFADAYCIHARLAVRLAALGKHDEAVQHYRRAYELMPDQFGRLESYCFGCEGAFMGERAQDIAEKVFLGFARKTPDKPQVYYLLGYLREAQERHRESLDYLRKAVQLDPDYINAWKKIQTMSELKQVHLSAGERDSVALNLLRLDPLGRHGTQNSFRLMSDLKALWESVEKTQSLRTAKPSSVYPLAASKAQIQSMQRDDDSEGSLQMPTRFVNHRWQEEGTLTPAKAVATNGYVSAAMGLIGRPEND